MALDPRTKLINAAGWSDEVFARRLKAILGGDSVLPTHVINMAQDFLHAMETGGRFDESTADKLSEALPEIGRNQLGLTRAQSREASELVKQYTANFARAFAPSSQYSSDLIKESRRLLEASLSGLNRLVPDIDISTAEGGTLTFTRSKAVDTTPAASEPSASGTGPSLASGTGPGADLMDSPPTLTPATGTGATGSAGSVPPVTPVLRADATWGEVQAYIEENIPTIAWMVRIPSLRRFVIEASQNNWDSQQLRAQLGKTKWWQETNVTARQYLQLSNEDPATALANLEQATQQWVQFLRQAGSANATSGMAKFIASQVLTGKWDEATASQQALLMVDPFAPGALKAETKAVLDSLDFALDQTRQGEDRVEALVTQWLGPKHGRWSKDQIARWAGRVRNDPDGEQALVDLLQGQRMSLFPEYENPNLTYEDIAGPWRGVWSDVWGSTPDEMDPLFTKLIRQNDVAEAEKALRTEGLQRGVTKVEQDATRAVATAFGGSQRRSL